MATTYRINLVYLVQAPTPDQARLELLRWFRSGDNGKQLRLEWEAVRLEEAGEEPASWGKVFRDQLLGPKT
jgi:hypothetical protein